ncbi:MAG TPA: peroxidase-related enzyme [Gaiellaceae bacterium]|nr:peroxidase-related enzyme [Gaiellaceae bacterium]
MAYLRLIDEGEATGELEREYEAAVARAGRVMNILKGMSLSPRVLAPFLALNREINFAPSQLDRIDRELLAVVVSEANGAHYSVRAHEDLLRNEGGAEPLDARRRALCDFARKLTLRPAEMAAGDVEALRAYGLSDAAVSDAIQVVAFFNYVNRVVTAVGVDDEPEWASAPTPGS